MDDLVGKPAHDVHVHGNVISLACANAGVATTEWTYRRTGSDVLVELGTWCGDVAPGLGMHFHDEAQLVFVLAGARFFLVHSAPVVVLAGQCIYIPSGLPHRALANPSPGTRCLNAYVSVEGLGDMPLVIDIDHSWTQMGQVRLEEVMRAFNNQGRCVRDGDGTEHVAVRHLGRYLDGTERVGDLALRNGYTREGFSRQFVREVGIPPHAYRIVARLNHARRLLRAGEPIAAVAAQTGFADQSHLGRLFRRTFGATPGAYART